MSHVQLAFAGLTFRREHGPLLLSLFDLPCADRSKEWLQVMVQVIFRHTHVPVEKEEKLFLHEINFGCAEAKVLKSRYPCVPRPVLVLGGRVIEILGCEDQGSKKDAVD